MNWSYVYTITIVVMLVSCSSVKYTGVVDVEDLRGDSDGQQNYSKKIVLSNDEIMDNYPKIKEKIDKTKLNIIKGFRNNLIKIEKEAERNKILQKEKLSGLTNLKKLGVIDITSRLSNKMSKKSKYSQDRYYVVRKKPNENTFGGKLICQEQVLILRLDRSKLIECMIRERKVRLFNWKTFLIDYRFINVRDYKREEIFNNCKLIHAVSLSAYNDLSSCLIEDKKAYGLFKYRNINSFGVQFNLIRKKNEKR